MKRLTGRPARGFTMVELIITLGLFGLLCMVAVSNIKVLENPLVSAAANLSQYFRLVRVRAIAQTRSIIVEPTSQHRLTASAAANCTSETLTPIDELELDIGDDVSLGSTDWSVCFTQRGLVHAAALFTLSSETGIRTVEIALGGGVQIR